MSAVPDKSARSQIARPDTNGRPTFDWTLTSSSIVDTVRLTIRPDVLPVIFVPGIMGSNLRAKEGKEPIWRLDKGFAGLPTALMRKFVGTRAGLRQQLLHPDRTEVDPDGNVPKFVPGVGHADVIRERGWGQVGEDSYQEFLIWLEAELNPSESNPARWNEFYQTQATIQATPKPGDEPKLFSGIRMGMQGEPFGAEQPFDSLLSDDLLKRSKYLMPVHAVGYNWLASNQEAAENRLQPEINRIITKYNTGQYSCKQVILVTHSMGGLVARACANLPGMAEKIAGIVHGVMPAQGAAVAYRRCKVGMADEDMAAGLVIGNTGQEVTAVFAQAPGALQLLPSQDYQAGWLRIEDGPTILAKYPVVDPYKEIYLQSDRWWGLFDEAWLAPVGGLRMGWKEVKTNIGKAKSFHSGISGKYHRNTYVFYGADTKKASFANVTWRLKRGLTPSGGGRAPSATEVLEMSNADLRMVGSTPEYVGGATTVLPSYNPLMGHPITIESSYWEIHCLKQDDKGDGTVPQNSGRAPKGQVGVKQTFRLTGFAHEAAYRASAPARKATVYAITKIAGTAEALG